MPLEKQTAQQLVKVADKLFSQYIRLRDSEYVNGEFVGTCITCRKTGTIVWFDDSGKTRFTRGWDNGHFVGRGTFVTRYEEENNNLQCSYACNKMNSGHYQKYKLALRKKYGEPTPERLESLAEEYPGRSYHFSKEELLTIIHDAKAQIEYIVAHRA